ncbi:MAG: tRNA (adenosine(37)-N6)-dimethylallyltransferase MiaA [Bacteroidales bacterium]
MKHTLIVLIGPTGVGKTNLSFSIAERYHTSIISSDSRQLYRDLVIGTAAPSRNDLERVKHYLVGTLGLEDYYSAARFEEEVMSLLPSLFEENPVQLMTGGSMMYVDALCKGIDDLPTVTDDIRSQLLEKYNEAGLDVLCEELRQLDPVYYEQVDRKNPKRVIHALEICYMTGRPYSDLRTNTVKQRPFRIIKIGLTRDRQELYDRINKRVDVMVENGLIDEARKVYPYKNYNSLNTVGYKELFAYFDGDCTLDFAIDKIKQNSRIYSKKQMTWFKRDAEIQWFNPDNESDILSFLDKELAYKE